MTKDQKLYGTKGQERLDESVENVVCDMLGACDADAIQWPIRVLEFHRVDPSGKRDHMAHRVLAKALGELDEEFGDPDSDGTEPTPAMQAAAKAFVDAVLSEYVSYACEPTGEVIEVTREQAERMVI